MRGRQPAGFITRPFTGRKRAVYGSQTGGLRAVNGRVAKTGRLWFAMKAAGVLSKKAGVLSKKAVDGNGRCGIRGALPVWLTLGEGA